MTDTLPAALLIGLGIVIGVVLMAVVARAAIRDAIGRSLW